MGDNGSVSSTRAHLLLAIKQVGKNKANILTVQVIFAAVTIPLVLTLLGAIP